MGGSKALHITMVVIFTLLQASQDLVPRTAALLQDGAQREMSLVLQFWLILNNMYIMT